MVIQIKNVELGYKNRAPFDYKMEDTKVLIQSSDGEETWWYEDVSMNVPKSWGFSAAVDMNEKVTLVGEYQEVEYSGLKDRDVHSIVYDYSDGKTIRFGFEYRQSEMISLRGGAFSETAFLFDDNKGDPKSLRGTTLGLGLKYGVFILDAGMEYYSYKHEPVLVGRDVKGHVLNFGLTLSIIDN